jgi:hypothetical protein
MALRREEDEDELRVLAGCACPDDLIGRAYFAGPKRGFTGLHGHLADCPALAGRAQLVLPPPEEDKPAPRAKSPFPRHCWDRSPTCEARATARAVMHPTSDCNDCKCADLECRCVCLRPSVVPSPKRTRRGRPIKPYAEHLLSQRDRASLRSHLIKSFHQEGPFPNWYTPAAHERLGNGLTLKWLKTYPTQHPADWKRALERLGRSTTWAEATAEGKSQRDRADRFHGPSILSDGDDPVYRSDLARLGELFPYLRAVSKLSPDRHGMAFIDRELIRRPDHETGRRLSAEVKKLRFGGSIEVRARLAAIARDEREYLLPYQDDYPGSLMWPPKEPVFALNHPTIRAQKQLLVPWLALLTSDECWLQSLYWVMDRLAVVVATDPIYGVFVPSK